MKHWSRVTGGLFVGLAALTAGCASMQGPGLVPLEVGEVQGPLGVEVALARADVTVEVDPDAPAPSVRALAGEGQRGVPGWMQTSVSPGENGSTLRVSGEGDDWVTLRIVLPQASGVDVSVASGQVRLVNVSGPVKATAGVSHRDNTAIVLQTREALRGPVDLRASVGAVQVRVGEQSEGILSVTAPSGFTSVNVGDGPTRAVTWSRNTWRGTVAEGERDWTISTGEGDIRILFQDEATLPLDKLRSDRETGQN